MGRIKWDVVGERLFETGVRHGVLYPQDKDGTYPLGVAWNGLTAISEAPTGGEANPQYADDIKYLNLFSAEEFAGSISAFYYPDEWEACDGSAEVVPGISVGQQSRIPFGLVYSTRLGNDTQDVDYGYKLHLVYGAKASPSQKEYATINDSPEAATFSWDFTTTPTHVNVEGFKPTATIVLDSTKLEAGVLKALEDVLYGKDGVPEDGETPAVDPVNPRLPLPDEVFEILGAGK